MNFCHENGKHGSGGVSVLTGCMGTGEMLPIHFIEKTLKADQYLWYLME